MQDSTHTFLGEKKTNRASFQQGIDSARFYSETLYFLLIVKQFFWI